MKKVHWKSPIVWGDVLDKAHDMILSAAALALPGEDKHEWVVNELAKWIDDQLVFGDGPIGRIAEAVDRPIAKAILSLVIHEVYGWLKEEGKV